MGWLALQAIRKLRRFFFFSASTKDRTCILETVCIKVHSLFCKGLLLPDMQKLLAELNLSKYAEGLVDAGRVHSLAVPQRAAWVVAPTFDRMANICILLTSQCAFGGILARPASSNSVM